MAASSPDSPAGNGRSHGRADGAALDRVPAVGLLGVRVHAVTLEQCADRVMEELEAGRGGWVYTPNVDHLRRLVQSEEYAALCASASLVVADGMPLVWASRLQGTPLPERVAGSDLVLTLADRAAARGRSLYLLGGNPGAADGAASVLRRRQPSLSVLGTMCPQIGFERDPVAMDEIVRVLCEASPDIVYLGLGSPLADRVVERLRPLLPRTWWLTIGISFSFITGEVRRAPRWMQATGLEWTHRLLQEPGRLSGRYLRHGVPFTASLLARSAWCRLFRPAGRPRVPSAQVMPTDASPSLAAQPSTSPPPR